jgi:hypothetical protein
MKLKIASAVIAAAAAAAAGTALAESPTIVHDEFVFTKSRAEVQAELLSYKQAGVNPWSTSYDPLRSFHSKTTRGQAVADYIASRDEVTALHGEDSGSAYLAQATGQRAPASTTLASRQATMQ